MPTPKNSAPHLEETLWQHVMMAAQEGGLNPEKFDHNHRQVVRHIAQFLVEDNEQEANDGRSLLSRLIGNRNREPSPPAPKPVPPIIISGIPGTGKTTFLYLIDAVLRNHFNLPDYITSTMRKRDGTTFSLQKRHYCGKPISLLSVRKWTELLYFYHWDVEAHGLNSDDLNRFIQQTLRPMRILFADEVEMTGYAPTLPNLAQSGILLVGTSNQAAFAQLENDLNPPIIIPFSGEDMRLGDPSDAIVAREGHLWNLFKLAHTYEEARFESLPFHPMRVGETAVILIPFQKAISSPMLESDWIHFLQQSAQISPDDPSKATPIVLLLDGFSLAQLQGNFNAIIRFVTLFDVIEQFGIGVLIRNTQRTPKLSPEAVQQMKISIKSRAGVDPEIKKRTLAGIDRWISRLGQAGHKAKTLLGEQNDDAT